MSAKPTTNPTYPTWLSGAAIRHMNGILRDVQRDAGITENIRILYTHEQDVLKRELPANSLLYVPSSSYNAPFRLCCILTGSDARNDKARVTMSLTTAGVEKLRSFLLSQPQSIYQIRFTRDLPAVQYPPPPEIELVEAPATTDAEARAIFLADVRSHGRNITRDTAESCTGGQDPELIKDCVTRGLLTESGAILSLTTAGDSFLALCFDSPPAPIEQTQGSGEHEFDRLRTAVKRARENHAAIQAEHAKHATARTLLAKELEAARAELKSAEDMQKSLQQRIEDTQAKAVKGRSKVLQLESEQRLLPDGSKLAAAQQELEAAEKAYKQFVEEV